MSCSQLIERRLEGLHVVDFLVLFYWSKTVKLILYCQRDDRNSGVYNLALKQSDIQSITLSNGSGLNWACTYHYGNTYEPATGDVQLPASGNIPLNNSYQYVIFRLSNESGASAELPYIEINVTYK